MSLTLSTSFGGDLGDLDREEMTNPVEIAVDGVAELCVGIRTNPEQAKFHRLSVDPNRESLDAVLSALLQQGLPVDPKDSGGAGVVRAGLSQDLADVARFELVESPAVASRSGHELVPAAEAGRRQRGGGDAGALFDHRGAFDDVAQLAKVARPGMIAKHPHCVVIHAPNPARPAAENLLR